MDIIYLQKSTDRLNLKEGQLIHTSEGEEQERYPICGTELIQVYGNGQITTQAIKECLKEGVRINYFSSHGKYLGRLEPGYPKNIRRRLNQYGLYFDIDRRLTFCRALIYGKLAGALVELRRLREKGYKIPEKELRHSLRKWQNAALSAKNLESLLGIEGQSARTYYSIFHHVLPSGLEWHGRSYHPAKDGINHILSYVYSLTAGKIREELEKRSLDPWCSYLHEPDYGRGGLSYDLLELFRATFCDNLVIRTLERNERASDYLRHTDSNTYLPDWLCDCFEKSFAHELGIRHGYQKVTPLEQIRQTVQLFTESLSCERLETEYILSLHPER